MRSKSPSTSSWSSSSIRARRTTRPGSAAPGARDLPCLRRAAARPGGGPTLTEQIVAKVDALHTSEDFGRFQVEPLERGFGLTLGNALRRVLLSSLAGAAVTQVKVDGIYHEFATLPGVKEDTTELILNLKQLRLKSYTDQPTQLRLISS